MTIHRLGEVSLLSLVPLLTQFEAALQAAVGFAVPELQAKLGGLQTVLGAITVTPPSMGATLLAAQQTVVSLQAAIGGPTVTLQGAAIIALIAELTASLGALTASAALSLPNATVAAYVYDGSSASIGAELQAAVSADAGPTHVDALIIMTADPAAWAVVGQVFAV